MTEISPFEAFNQTNTFIVFDRVRIKNLLSNLSVGKSEIEYDGLRIIFTTIKKGNKPATINSYLIPWDNMTEEQLQPYLHLTEMVSF